LGAAFFLIFFFFFFFIWHNVRGKNLFSLPAFLLPFFFFFYICIPQELTAPLSDTHCDKSLPSVDNLLPAKRPIVIGCGLSVE